MIVVVCCLLSDTPYLRMSFRRFLRVPLPCGLNAYWMETFVGKPMGISDCSCERTSVDCVIDPHCFAGTEKSDPWSLKMDRGTVGRAHRRSVRCSNVVIT